MIRTILGFLIVYGAVGGIETSVSDLDLMVSCLIAALGFMMMMSGIATVNKG
jgi:hypothetical protein